MSEIIKIRSVKQLLDDVVDAGLTQALHDYLIFRHSVANIRHHLSVGEIRQLVQSACRTSGGRGSTYGMHDMSDHSRVDNSASWWPLSSRWRVQHVRHSH